MKNYVFLSLLLLPVSVQAWECEHSKSIDLTLDLSGSEELLIQAAAGDLNVRGVADSDRAVIKGKVCTSEEKWLADSVVETREGTRAEITVVLPDLGSNWSLMGQKYAYLDLELEVPDHLALDIRDSSGDVEISGVGALTIKDSSGDIDIEDSAGPVNVNDSSGDIELVGIRQDVTIESDSSGDIRGRDIGGTVRVLRDSSGDIDFRDVGASFIVERDSSGDISANRVGGDFKVMRDGSGEIDARNVEGAVEIPDDGS
ncbi:MAG: DUF4097 family beta strand repeat protein [Xanthomonadales bacterium]|nr:DUF4097 family beta strand repeat protein [Gammaproteobacteria bacterium]MBT8052891.1 DUF4097 family beta strand repeat protein [Gammaproteobacteria bacterium]NND55648.1 DUF4097 family beta strand repeat protein [Xanthomonadales bacterium]NNK49959.1 DUF4097 family beta strand repeat protein [Xanthomonadales bacterium]